ncbi:MAG: hypothetical protein LBV80_06500 [Deltaproteobacteria bacterium]|nr:hypothetical protein [Deltaproteobacteria bacterium]
MITIEIPHANPAWKLIMQSGARLDCTVGITLSELLRHELALSDEQLAPVDTLILDGMPVDEPEKTVVPDNSRLALACALPGIAGLAMKKGSAVRGLRYHITHGLDESSAPHSGWISLFLYSLTLPQLAGHFLTRGIIVGADQIIRYARFAPEDRCHLTLNQRNGADVLAGPGNLNKQETTAAELEKILSGLSGQLPEISCRLFAEIMS